MKSLALAAVTFAFAAIVCAEEPTTSTSPGTQPQTKDSALVQASRAARSRKKSTTKTITNADVKKSNGKLSVSTPPPAPAAADMKTSLAKQDDERRAREAADAKVAAAQKKFDDLDKELRRIEQSYYDSNDPAYRDDVIRREFEKTKLRCDVARRELAEAREAREKLP